MTVRPCILAVVVLVCCAQLPPDPCPNDAPGAMCIVANQTLNLGQPFTLQLNGSVTFINTVVTQVLCNTLPSCPEGELGLIAGGDVILVNSTVYAPSLTVLAGNISIDAASMMIADASGPTLTAQTGAGGEVDGAIGTGGGHGGAGSNILGCRTNPPLGKPGGSGFGFANVSTPFQFGGSSQGWGPGRFVTSRGGGRIWLEALDTITMAGRVSANGQTAPLGPVGCYCGPGGGAGGSIFVGSQTINVTTSGAFSAVGGDSTYTGGGGGGIVSLNALSIFGSFTTAVNVSGGATLDSTMFSNCLIGGTGLYFWQELFAHTSADLHVPVTAPRTRYLRRHPRAGEIATFTPHLPSVYHADAAAVWDACLAVQAATRRRSVRECPRHVVPPLDAATGADVQPLRRIHPRPPSVRDDEPYGVHDPTTGEWLDMSGALVEGQETDPSVPSDERLCWLSHPRVIPADYRSTWLCQDGLQPHMAAPAPASTAFSTAADAAVYEAVLTCSSQVVRNNLAPLTQTVVDSLQAISNVAMTNCAWDLSQLSQVLVQTWKLIRSSLQVSQFLLTVNGTMLMEELSRVIPTSTSATFNVQLAQSLSISSSLINAGFVVISTPFDVSVGAQAYIRFSYEGLINAGTLSVSSVFTQTDIPPGLTSLRVSVANMTMGLATQVSPRSVCAGAQPFAKLPHHPLSPSPPLPPPARRLASCAGERQLCVHCRHHDAVGARQPDVDGHTRRHARLPSQPCTPRLGGSRQPHTVHGAQRRAGLRVPRVAARR